MMQGPQMQQLRQRVIASYHLGPLDKSETQAYIEHRLNHVGWKGDPQFEPATFDLIHTVSGGIPRRINTLCNRLLLAGFLGEKHAFDTARRAGDRARDPRGARSGGVARRGADDDTAKRRRRHRRVARAAIRARCSAHFREIEERIERLEKTVGAAVDLLHRLLHPRTRDQARHAGRPLMGEILRPLGPLVCVVGARPNYMKMAPLLRAFAQRARTCPASCSCIPGQHYDVAMNERLFADLELPAPDLNLEVGSGTHAVQTAEVMRRFEPVVDELKPSCVDRRRRRQFDARLQPRREQEAHAGRARRGRTAQLRPRHARGDQPHPHRPDRRRPLHDRARRRGQPRARRHRRGAHRSSSAT